MQRVFVVHGWASSPEDAWFPWLKNQLEQHACAVQVLALPNPKRPDPDAWLAHIEAAVGVVDENTYFVAHSLGCRATALFLQTRAPHETAGGAVFVAGTFIASTEPHPHPLAELVRAQWGSLSVSPSALRAHVQALTALYCVDDPWVSFDNAAYARDVLGAQLLVEEGKGHFRGLHDNVRELPAVRDAVLAQMRI